MNIDLSRGHLSDYGRDHLHELFGLHLPVTVNGRELKRILGGSGSMSNYLETHVLDHANGKTSFTLVTPVYLALCTVVPDSSKTGSTITEATYTGYARASLNAAAWNAAVSGGAGGASSATNASTITFAACTASSSTIIGWALCDALTTGNMFWWGSATSTVISTTQTPATVPASGLTVTLT